MPGADKKKIVLSVLPNHASVAASVGGSLIKAFSPVVDLTETDDGVEITVKDIEGEKTATVYNGEQGPEGPRGPDGEPGVSPAVAVSEIDGGVLLTVTDAEGEHSATIWDGADGLDGVSPEVNVTDIAGGHRVTVTDAEGTQTFDVMNGADGKNGKDGTNGTNGTDGVSPTANVSKTGSVATITITDREGTTSAEIRDGTDGKDGTDGISPTASVTKSGKIATVTITDRNGTTTARIRDGTDGTNGKDGKNGTDGVSPTATVTQTASGATITVTDGTGTTTADIENGANGTNGEDGFSPIADVTKSGGTATITITDRQGTTTAQIFDGANGTNGTDGTDGADGVTFTPAVSGAGVISWTNNGGLPNPESVNIKGPQGDPGDDYVLTAQDKTDIAALAAAEIDVSGKADKVSGAVSGNFAGLDANGNLTDSGSKASDFLTQHQAIPVTDVQVNGSSVVSNTVANVPVATTEAPGAVKINPNNGIGIGNTGNLYVNTATSAILKAGTSEYRAIVPSNQHSAAFYGLAKAAGDVTQASSDNAVGTYTAEAKAAIKSMLGIQDGTVLTETVSGTSVTIAGEPNMRYVCGEVTSISITPPNTGTIVVRFTSGSTVAVLTLPNTVVMTSWFDPTALDTNTTYEICIEDGVYGSVMLWDA